MAELIGVSGSLRAGSYNTALLRAAAELVPDGTTLEVVSIDSVPLYNADLDVDVGPEPVRLLKRKIADADGLVIASPEYNYGVPGVLKNAIDWASRPAYTSVLARKPVAIMGASMSLSGSVRAQAQLKQVLLGTLSLVFPYPEVAVGVCHTKFDEGRLADDATRAIVEKMLAAFVNWLEGWEAAQRPR